MPPRSITILCWPYDRPCDALDDWCRWHFPGAFRYVRRRGWLDVVRCQVAREALSLGPQGDDAELWFADGDVAPTAETDALLDARGDVVGAEYPCACGAWQLPYEVHMGLLKVRREVLETLIEERDAQGRHRPLFAVARSPDNTVAYGCECRWFARRAREAGFETSRIGRADHLARALGVPIESFPGWLQ
jgi:hypothetical protein